MDKILKAADDIAAVFNVTQEWLEPGRSAVVKILKQLVEEKFTSTNTGSPKLPACGECQLWCVCGEKIRRGDSDCLEARSQLRASA